MKAERILKQATNQSTDANLMGKGPSKNFGPAGGGMQWRGKSAS